MASTARFLVFLIVAFALASPASPSRPAKVSVAFYYESLCPYCSSFIVNHLAGIFRDGLISVVDLDLVPYGNAHLGPNSTISCQHGPNECLLNTMEACAISAWPDLHKHFSFIYCVESLVVEHKHVEWESCFSKVGLDSKAVSDCYASGHGKEVMTTKGEGWGKHNDDAATCFLTPAKTPSEVGNGATIFVESGSSTALTRGRILFHHIDLIPANFYSLLSPSIVTLMAEFASKLELHYAAQTDSLQPPHRFVPWVVVNGQPLYEDYINLEAYICKAYDGEPPMACLRLLMNNHQGAKVSYALPLLPVTERRGQW